MSPPSPWARHQNLVPNQVRHYSHRHTAHALSNGDSEIIAAVSLRPAVLLGINPKDQERYLAAIREMKAPELITESEDLSEALQTASAARDLARIMFDENYNAAEQAAIDQAELDAAAAETALTASME